MKKINHPIPAGLVLLIIIVSGFLQACGPARQNLPDSNFITDSLFGPRHAKLFRLGRVDGHRAIWVNDPWKKGHIIQKFILLPRGGKEISIPEGYTPVYQPVRSIATTSSTLLSHLTALSSLQLLTGVSDTAYIFNEEVRARIRLRKIAQIAIGEQIYDEVLIENNPDVAFFSLFKGQAFSKLTEIGIKIIPFADYLEEDPLGRAEWLKFAAAFLGREAEADSLFRLTETKYLALKRLAAQNTKHEKIFDGMMTGGVWYISGGRSYMARLYADAGLDYVFAHILASSSHASGMEEVYEAAAHAGIWRIIISRQEPFTRKHLLDADSRYGHFEAFKTGKILVCNAASTPYYEQGVARPDMILSDLLHCVSPELLPGYEPIYYKILP